LHLAVEFGDLSFETRFPLGDLLLAAIELGHTLARASFVGREFFDGLVQLALAVIELAVPRFDGGFAILKPLAAIGPGLAVFVERGKALLELRIVASQLGVTLTEARFALVEGLSADVRQFGGAGFDDLFSFGEVGLLRFEVTGATFELLLAFFEPLLRIAKLGVEIGFLRSKLGCAAIEGFAFLLEAIGELGRVLAELVDRVLDEARAIAPSRRLSRAG